MPGNYSIVYTESAGNSILAARRNAEHQNHIDKMEPQYMDDYSTNAAEMRTTEDPGESSTESLPTSLQGELTRLRFAILEIKQALDSSLTYWYESPTTGVVTTGPSTTVDNTLPRYNGVAGQLQTSLITTSDQDELVIPVTALVTTSVNTTFNATSVVDASAADLSAVLVGDLMTASGGSTALVTVIDDGADTLTTGAWVGGTPSNGETVAVSRPGSFANQGITDAQGELYGSRQMIGFSEKDNRTQADEGATYLDLGYGSASSSIEGTTTFGIPMPRAGSIVGGSIIGNISASTGTGTFAVEIMVNNVSAFVIHSDSFTGTGVKTGASTQLRGVDTFAAGDFVTARFSTAATITTFQSDETVVAVELQFDT